MLKAQFIEYIVCVFVCGLNFYLLNYLITTNYYNLFLSIPCNLPLNNVMNISQKVVNKIIIQLIG